MWHLQCTRLCWALRRCIEVEVPCWCCQLWEQQALESPVCLHFIKPAHLHLMISPLHLRLAFVGCHSPPPARPGALLPAQRDWPGAPGAGTTCAAGGGGCCCDAGAGGDTPCGAGNLRSCSRPQMSQPLGSSGACFAACGATPCIATSMRSCIRPQLLQLVAAGATAAALHMKVMLHSASRHDTQCQLTWSALQHTGRTPAGGCCQCYAGLGSLPTAPAGTWLPPGPGLVPAWQGTAAAASPPFLCQTPAVGRPLSVEAQNVKPLRQFPALMVGACPSLSKA